MAGTVRDHKYPPTGEGAQENKNVHALPEAR